MTFFILVNFENDVERDVLMRVVKLYVTTNKFGKNLLIVRYHKQKT